MGVSTSCVLTLSGTQVRPALWAPAQSTSCVHSVLHRSRSVSSLTCIHPGLHPRRIVSCSAAQIRGRASLCSTPRQHASARAVVRHLIPAPLWLCACYHSDCRSAPLSCRVALGRQVKANNHQPNRHRSEHTMVAISKRKAAFQPHAIGGKIWPDTAAPSAHVYSRPPRASLDALL